MKFVEALIIAIIGSVVGSLITYFSGLLSLPFAIVILFLILLFVINLYSIPEVNTRISKLEKNTRANSLAIKAIINAFIKIFETLSKRKEITRDNIVHAFGDATIGISKSVIDEYFSNHSEKSGNPHTSSKQRIRELLEQARQKRISFDDAQVLRNLLEEQKKEHEASGDISSVILIGLLILFVLAIIGILASDKGA